VHTFYVLRQRGAEALHTRSSRDFGLLRKTNNESSKHIKLKRTPVQCIGKAIQQEQFDFALSENEAATEGFNPVSGGV